MNTAYEGAASTEWLETNGLGGYAGATVSGANTRRYHGLLVVATHPPVGRVVMLSRLDEEIIEEDQVFELGCNQYTGAIHPQGYQYIRRFSRELFPEWTYELPSGTRITKTVAAIHGENTTVILYRVQTAGKKITMKWLPLVAARDFHSVRRANSACSSDCSFEQEVFRAKPYPEAPELFIHIPGAGIHLSPQWFNNVEYAAEQYRGLEFVEDLFNHGKFSREVHDHDQFGIIISDMHPGGRDALQLLEQEKKRRMALVAHQDHPVTGQLHFAADQFIVRRGADLKTIIAGYHWFSDWGRDTMIALPGLCLSTGRFDDARSILLAFAQHVNEGMLPNRFPDYEGDPIEYNTVDATLWYFVAVHRYRNVTGDREFVRTHILPALKEIIDWHFRGTRYHIKADPSDGMLEAGEHGEQLTWMDARIGDWVVTPRMGKPVEINALWYNALMIFAGLLRENGQEDDAGRVFAAAQHCRTHFAAAFWNPGKRCLYDCIQGDEKDDSVRPNQVFALSLPFPLIEDPEKAKDILTMVTEALYTPVGLRSLAPGHPEYRKNYGGDPYQRDSAYHQGTAWSWLLGTYIDAVIATPSFTWVDGSSGYTAAKTIVRNALYHLNEACIGSVSEIFDAEHPFTPRGCVAQAWGVGEWLRVIVDYQLLDMPVEKKDKSSPVA